MKPASFLFNTNSFFVFFQFIWGLRTNHNHVNYRPHIHQSNQIIYRRPNQSCLFNRVLLNFTSLIQSKSRKISKLIFLFIGCFQTKIPISYPRFLIQLPDPLYNSRVQTHSPHFTLQILFSKRFPDKNSQVHHQLSQFPYLVITWPNSAKRYSSIWFFTTSMGRALPNQGLTTCNWNMKVE